MFKNEAGDRVSAKVKAQELLSDAMRNAVALIRWEKLVGSTDREHEQLLEQLMKLGSGCAKRLHQPEFTEESTTLADEPAAEEQEEDLLGHAPADDAEDLLG